MAMRPQENYVRELNLFLCLSLKLVEDSIGLTYMIKINKLADISYCIKVARRTAGNKVDNRVCSYLKRPTVAFSACCTLAHFYQTHKNIILITIVFIFYIALHNY